MWRSAPGLLDCADPDAGRKLREELDRVCADLAINYHGVRFRGTGDRAIVEIITHLEAHEDHGESHAHAHYTGRP
jgi:divalent metal cation (Fe/Co/Zn/Cd) transporter